jgi:hypothetical protein
MGDRGFEPRTSALSVPSEAPREFPGVLPFACVREVPPGHRGLPPPFQLLLSSILSSRDLSAGGRQSKFGGHAEVGSDSRTTTREAVGAGGRLSCSRQGTSSMDGSCSLTWGRSSLDPGGTDERARVPLGGCWTAVSTYADHVEVTGRSSRVKRSSPRRLVKSSSSAAQPATRSSREATSRCARAASTFPARAS